MTRPGLQTAIPLRIPPLTPPPIGIHSSIPDPAPIILETPPAPTMLHKDFTNYVEEVNRLLGLLREYQLTPTARSESSGYPEELITYLLETLVSHRYIQAQETGKRPYRRTVITITPKGLTALNEFAHYFMTSNSPSSPQS